jgi:ATP-dependent DNA ligase
MIKEILDEITAISGTNDKIKALSQHSDNAMLKVVLYRAHSKRVKFYLRQIPEYTPSEGKLCRDIGWALRRLEDLQFQRVSGNEAIEHLKETLESISKDDATVIELIIGKSTKTGLGTTNMNKVFKNLIEKTPYQGAKPFTEDLARKLFDTPHAREFGVRSDIKMDGRYANGLVQSGDVEAISRQGEITHVGDALFLKELSQFPDCVLNGELTIDGLDRYTANGIVASIVDIEGKRETRGPQETSKKINAFTQKHGDYFEMSHNIRYTVWDMITTDEYFDKKSKRPYEERRALLVQMLDKFQTTKISMVESKIVFTYAEAVQHFQEALSRGLEGTIIKDMQGAWKDGKPTWQIKMKLEIDVDLKIVGFNYGTGKNINVISSLDCESSDGLIKTSPTGIKEVMMQHITETQSELLDTILEVKCSGLSQARTGEYSLLHPVFKILRDDKDTCDSLDDIKQIELAAKTLS